MQQCDSTKSDIIDANMVKPNIDQIVIPDSLYAHFPQKQSIKGLLLCSAGMRAKYSDREGVKMTTFAEAYMMEVYRNLESKKALINRLISECKAMAVDSIRPADGSYFIMTDEREMLLMYQKSRLKAEYRQAIDKFILPVFHEEMRRLKGINYCTPTLCGLPKEYEILILKSGREYVLPHNDSWKFDWDVLPRQMKHGYSSGIAYGEADGIIIYWCIAW
jgi:hypothetical protein